MKRLIKKIICALLCLWSILSFVPNVYATEGFITGGYNSSDLSLSGRAQFYNTSRTELTTSSMGLQYFYTDTSNQYGYLSLQLNQSLATDTLYTITIYMYGQGASMGSWESNIVSTGSTLSNANSNNQSGTCRATVWGHSDTWNTFTDIYTSSTQTVPGSTGMYYFTFTTSCDNHTFLNIPWYFSSSPSRIQYYGYHLEILGRVDNLSKSDVESVINNSGLATASSVDEVNKGVNEVKQELSNIDSTINNTDITDANASANSFFDNFQTDTYGLSDIITMPLTLIRSLTNSTCVSLKLTIPFVNKELELPCMSSIYSQYFGSFFSLYQTITFGFVAYWVVVRIFNLVKDFKNPDHDEIEVLDL